LHPAIPLDLAPGGSVTCTGSYTVDQGDLDAGSVLNVASATGTDPDDVETTDTDTEEVFATQSPAISIAKTALDSSYAAPGDVLDYELVATNTGNVTLTDVTVSDPLLGRSVAPRRSRSTSPPVGP